MTTYVTPKKNAQYIFYIALVSQANTKLVQANPTLQAADFNVSGDGGALGALGTTPTVTPASGRMVKVTLSNTEMNFDNVTLVCSDNAGSEWCDLVVNIQTSARQIDDLAYPATSGRSMVIDAAGLVDANTVTLGPTGAGTAQTAKDVGGAVPAAAAGASGGLLISGSNAGTTTLAALTVTGTTTMSDGLVVNRSSSNTSAIVVTGNGTGSGVLATSGAGATGDGIKAVAASTNGHGVSGAGTGTGSGIFGQGGNGTNGDGAHFVAGTGASVGIRGIGGGTSGEGALFTATAGNSNGMSATGFGTGSGAVLTSGSAGSTGDGLKAIAASTNGNGITATKAGTGKDFNATSTALVLAKTTNITGFNDIAATAIVSGGAITTSGGAVSTVTTVTNQLTAAAIATGVWQDSTAGDFTTASSIGKALYIANVVPGAAGGHFIAGTNAATTITTGLTTTFTGNLTGSVGSVTGSVGSVVGDVSGGIAGDLGGDVIGSVVGNVDGNVVGTVASVVGNVGGNVTGSVGSVVGDVGGNLTGTVGGLTANALKDFFDTDSGSTYTYAVPGSVVAEIVNNSGGSSAPTVAEIVNGVWDEPTSSHTTPGTTGKALIDAGSAGDPWGTALPGAYGAGTAGYIVGTNLDDTVTSRMATYSQPTGFLAATFPSGTVANTTNITAGTITTVSGDVDGSVGGSVLGNVEGYVGGNVLGNLNGSIGSITATAAADLFLADTGLTFSDAAAGSVVKEIIDGSGGAAPTVADIVDGVWDEPIASHLTAGSTGEALDSASSGGDPWGTALPGAYGAGTAGKIVGDNINATITSRMASYAQPTGFLAATFPGTVASTTNITAGTVTTVSGNVNGSVGSVTGAVGSVTGLTASNLDVAVSSRMATYTQPTGFLAATFPSGTVANTTNITAGTITTVGTLTTYTGNTPQTGDSFARLGAPVGASISADIAAIDTVVSGTVDANIVAINGDAAAAATSAVLNGATVVYRGTVTGSATTTTLIDTGLVQADDDWWRGRIIIFTSVITLQATDITAYDAATGKLTFTAVTQAPTGATFVIV